MSPWPTSSTTSITSANWRATARHAAIGTDLDGGYGREQSPSDLDTIADLQQLTGLLAERGYGLDDIASILHGNWISFFHRIWSNA